MREYWDLFFAFAKVGVMTFGGGMAMLPMLQREIVENRRWVSEEELADYFAIGQCTPGIIAVNTATFVGHKRRGALGGIAATAGMVFPSLLIITALAGAISSFAHLPAVRSAFSAIQVCVCVLIFNAAVRLVKTSVRDAAAAVIFLLTAGAGLFLSVSPVWPILLSAAAGLILSRRGGEGQA